jgi:hypothetical protein
MQPDQRPHLREQPALSGGGAQVVEVAPEHRHHLGVLAALAPVRLAQVEDQSVGRLGIGWPET